MITAQELESLLIKAIESTNTVYEYTSTFTTSIHKLSWKDLGGKEYEITFSHNCLYLMVSFQGVRLNLPKEKIKTLLDKIKTCRIREQYKEALSSL